MKLTVAFDVDGTLIGQTFLDEDTPKYDVIALFHWFRNHGHAVLIWSGGGTDYAQRWAEKLGLEGAQIIPKTKEAAEVFHVDLTVDDEDCSLAAVNIKV